LRNLNSLYFRQSITQTNFYFSINGILGNVLTKEMPFSYL